ncbi:MAG: hypothetical protein IPJ65_40950 [Archangiaceae bacterium]|nr:hypothetical protein [Archangiaceae bacterium]
MRRLLVVLAVVGCGSRPQPVMDSGVPADAGMSTDAGADGGIADAGRSDAGMNPSRYWDGGSCAVKTDCPCFSNDDCAPTFRCVSEDATGQSVWCVPGVRGTGAAGDTCAVEGDCASALCIEPSTGVHRCSQLCDAPAECPATLPRCTYIGFGTDRSICSP